MKLIEASFYAAQELSGLGRCSERENKQKPNDSPGFVSWLFINASFSGKIRHGPRLSLNALYVSKAWFDQHINKKINNSTLRMTFFES